MHNQVNLIKFTESSKLDDVYHKIWQIFFDQISLIKIGKIGRVLFNQINLMKKSQSKLKFPHVKKKCEDKTANEWTWNIFYASMNSRLQIAEPSLQHEIIK